MKNVCNICGGNYIYKNGIWVCESCGAPAISEIGSEEDGWLHSAELALQKSDFDDAINDYNAVIEKFPNNPYAYWGRMLANYAIKYEIDPTTKKATPSFFDISYSSILSNSDYLKAVELSKDELHKHFIDEGNFLEELRIKLISKVENEDSFDIFISYKDKSDDVLGTITEDREKCKKIYDYLTSLGYKVFFAPISLKNHLGINFEPFIFKAIYTCQVMLVVGSKPEYFMSNWVKNEWSRYLRHIELREKNKNSLLPIISGFKETYLPKQLSKIECLDFDSSTFFESLKDYVSSIVSLDSYSFKKIQRRKRINIVNEQVSNDNKGIKLLKITPLKNNEVEKEIKKNIERKKLGQFLVKGIINKDIENKQIELDIYLANEQYEKVVSSCNEFLENNDNLWLILKYKLLGELKCKNLAEIKSLNDFNDFELINNLLESCPLTEANKILNGLSTSIFSFYVNGNFEFAFKLFNCVISYQSKIIDTLALNILSRRTIENKDKYWLKIQLLLLNNFDIDSDRDYLQFLITNLLEVRDYANFSIFADLYLKKFGLDSFSLVYKWIKENNSINETEAIIQMFGGNIETLVGKFKEISKNDVSLLLSKVEKILIDLINNKRYDACYKISLNYLKLKQNQAYINSFLNVCLNNCGAGIEQVVDLFLSVKKYASSDLKEKLLFNFAQKFNGICSFNVSTKYCKQVLSINIKNIDAYKLIIKNDIGICYDADFIKKLQLFSDYKILEQFFSAFDNEMDLIKELNNLIELALKNLRFKNDKKIYSFIDFVLQYYPETRNKDYVNSLFLIGNASKDLGFYENAKNYYLNILDIDNKNADAYWCLLLCNLKVKNDDELVNYDIPIATLTEFKNAVASAGIDRTKIERYISLSTKQEDCIKKKQIKKEKFKRGVIFSSVSLFVVVLTIVLSLLSVYVIIPNNNFNQVVSLLNNEKIDEAGDYLSINNVNRADELEKFVEAGTYFKNSDYINGIEKFLDAGGEVTINYDANGGSFDITTETIKPTKLKKQEFAEKTGYLFDKWEMTTFDFDLSNFDNCTAVVNLKASYTIINYEIKYELNGGKLDNAFNTYNVTCDDIHIGIPTKDGYTFKGWSTQYDSNPIEDFVIKSGTIGDIKLIANWEANEYTINYDYGYDNKTSSQNVIYDESYTLEEPQRDGYVFEGWYDDKIKIDSGVWNYTRDLYLKAKWEIITYTISYDLSGGTNNIDNPVSYSCITETFTLKDPYRFNYIFIGWSGTGIEGISKNVTIEKGSIGNRQYKANFKLVDGLIEISLDLNGAGKLEEKYIYTKFGDEYDLPAPVCENKSFLGWTTEDGKFVNNNGICVFENNIKLIANWSDTVSTGFEYVEYKDGIEITSLGTCNDRNLIFPSSINGKLVLSIDDGVLSRTNFDSISFPGTIIHLGKQISYHSGLCYEDEDGNLYFGNKVNPYMILLFIKSDSEKFETKKSTLIIPNGPILWYAEPNWSKLKEIVITENVIQFDGCVGKIIYNSYPSLERVYLYCHLGETNMSFMDCKNLNYLYLNNTLKKLCKSYNSDSKPFRNCTSLREISFNGTKEEWQQIDLGERWIDYKEDYIDGRTFWYQNEITIHCNDGDLIIPRQDYNDYEHM